MQSNGDEEKELIVNKEKYKERIEQCEKCDRRSMLNICKECGCVVVLKARLQSSSCPLGKW